MAENNILIIESGFSFHNMRGFTFNTSEKENPVNYDFQNCLINVCLGSL